MRQALRITAIVCSLLMVGVAGFHGLRGDELEPRAIWLGIALAWFLNANTAIREDN